MRLLFVADGRSPIALNWMRYLIEQGMEIHLITTFACDPIEGLASLDQLPVAFSGAAKPASKGEARPAGGARAIKLRAAVRHWAGPLTIPAAASRLRMLCDRISPDLVHAMRVPYEGMLAAAADPSAPLLISIWGNDFTLHAPASPLMRIWTKAALIRADALQTDCRRDVHLAEEWGFDASRPCLVVPGNGGIRPDVFRPGPVDEVPGSHVAGVIASIDSSAPVIVNPRGFRAYVRSDTFFEAIPEILAEHPNAVFLCPAMAGEAEAQLWVQRVGAESAVKLLPQLSPLEMAQVYRRAMITLSISEHDGTPNTLLEAMACGCVPIAGDLVSIREWIEDGVNGHLVDPGDPSALAKTVCALIGDDERRAAANAYNQRLIQDRASQPTVMKDVLRFYSHVTSSKAG